MKLNKTITYYKPLLDKPINTKGETFFIYSAVKVFFAVVPEQQQQG